MKAAILLAVVAGFIPMAASNDAPGAMTICESGRVNSNKCDNPNTMETCFEVPKTVFFKNKFLLPPEVSTGFTKLNMENNDNTRVNVLNEVTTQSLTINFMCLAKSHCISASIDFMACGFVDVAAWNNANGQ